MSTEQNYFAAVCYMDYATHHPPKVNSSYGHMSVLQMGSFSVFAKSLRQQCPKTTGLALASVELLILLQSQVVLG